MAQSLAALTHFGAYQIQATLQQQPFLTANFTFLTMQVLILNLHLWTQLMKTMQLELDKSWQLVYGAILPLSLRLN